MAFVLALLALIIVIVEAATHGFSLVLVAIGLVVLAELVGGYATVGNLIRR